MTFQNWTFAIFFVIFYAVYLPIRKTRFYIPWLLAASYVFYGWWNPLFLILILLTTTVDYLAVVAMAKTRVKKPWLVLSLMCNLGVLGFFKYGGFVIENLNALFSSLHLPLTIHNPGIILPIAISFFTFRSMTYTIDFYRGKIDRETSFLRYAAFVALFPQLLAGPIDRAGHLLPQLQTAPKITMDDITEGLSLFVVGLFKKVAVADYLALFVDKAFGTPDECSGSVLAMATFAYSWQIYFDFSGYTDMARGVARIMGFNLVLNFNNPYLATGLGDFWNRWHISLSTWFKDYVYIPLGGNRHGKYRTYLNMFLTMVVSGLWHGAAWTFVIWGALHAIGRVITRELELTPFYAEKVPRFVKQLAVFCFVSFAWIFFRSKSFGEAMYIVKKIFYTGPYTDPGFPVLALGLIASIWVYQFLFESNFKGILQTRAVRLACIISMLLFLIFFSSDTGQPFIYQQF